MEMQHPAGVRIILKKRDCHNTIALIDALGTVWYSIPTFLAFHFLVSTVFLIFYFGCLAVWGHFSQGGRMAAEREAATLQRFPYRRSNHPRQPLQRFLIGRCESTHQKRIVRPGIKRTISA
jgi:hypothetical protein